MPTAVLGGEREKAEFHAMGASSVHLRQIVSYDYTSSTV